MAEPRGASAELRRLLYIVPAAVRPGGVTLAELARELDTTERRILKDIQILTDRAFYHEAVMGSEVQVDVEGGRLRIHSTGPFVRPVRLTAVEALCVALGLRGAGLRDSALRRRLERDLALPGLDAVADGTLTSDAWSSAPDQLQAALHDAMGARRPVRFGYLKAGVEVPEVRTIDPWGLLHAEGHWYLVGRDHGADERRVFRMDRVLGVEPREGSYTIPEAWSPDDFLRDGRIAFRAPGSEAPATARVRYAPSIARWVQERWPGEADAEGGWIVEHEMLDPGWVVRHVLEYGTDAELLAPADLRDVVAAAARRMAGGS